MTLKENQKRLLEKINLNVRNSGNNKINPRYLNLSKLQIFIYILLNKKIIFIATKYFIKISKFLENILLIKANELTLLDPNISLKSKSFNSLENDKKYGYDEFDEIKRFFVNKKLLKKKSNDGLLIDRINYCINKTEKLISSDLEVKELLTIGCSYAYYESIIAEKCKKIEVNCFDRSEITATLNKREFSCANINFHHGEVIDFLIHHKHKCSIFNHMWTFCYLGKDFIEKIYSNLKNKTKYIILVEPFGISREKEVFYEFSFEDIPSVRYYRNIFMHNYPGILKKYNFDIETLQIKEIPNKQYSYLLYIVAKNNFYK